MPRALAVEHNVPSRNWDLVVAVQDNALAAHNQREFFCARMAMPLMLGFAGREDRAPENHVLRAGSGGVDEKLDTHSDPAVGWP